MPGVKIHVVTFTFLMLFFFSMTQTRKENKIHTWYVLKKMFAKSNKTYRSCRIMLFGRQWLDSGPIKIRYGFICLFASNSFGLKWHWMTFSKSYIFETKSPPPHPFKTRSDLTRSLTRPIGHLKFCTVHSGLVWKYIIPHLADLSRTIWSCFSHAWYAPCASAKSQSEIVESEISICPLLVLKRYKLIISSQILSLSFSLSRLPPPHLPFPPSP